MTVNTATRLPTPDEKPVRTVSGDGCGTGPQRQGVRRLRSGGPDAPREPGAAA